ncbi:hypothetical protein C2S51_015858 [Perilla frutescens var. frutescens]|nr:hypothetical protein C2S51_015858 [Perilla frutescens var. frutescens]
MAILLPNKLSPIFAFSSSNFITQIKYFGNTKLFRIACGDTKQNWSNAATSLSSTPCASSRAQENQFDPNDDVLQYEEKLENLRNALLVSMNDANPTESLIFVDTIQRLSVAHHYRKEIEMIMKQQSYNLKKGNTQNLRDVALSFRLLRQRGYHVSADLFNNFKGKDGKFRGEIKQDIWGLLELHEAVHLHFEGENILDEAQDFTVQLLHEHIVAADMELKWCNVVKMRLRNPYHKTITRLMTDQNNFQSDVGYINKWITTLTELSELDFVRAKCIHKDELLQVSKWWSDLGLNRELKLARNEPLKWYTWSMAILINNLSLSEERVQLTKSIAFIYLIDDVFDLYGALDDLTIFTEAVYKWDYAAIDMLPEYMKMCYISLLDTTNEIGRTIREKHGYNPINSLKQTWVSLCNAFLVEAKWFASRDFPGAKKYLVNGKVSSGVHVVLVHLFFLLGLGNRTNLDDISTLISSVSTILRLWDDLGSAEDEHQDGTDGSYIECYLRDNPGKGFEEAREHVVGMIGMEWKRLNKECFNLRDKSSASYEFEEGALNLARMVPLMYNYDHNQRLPILKEYMKLMLQ